MNAEYNPRMRREKTPRPRWWILYLILLSTAAALWFEARARMSARGHEAALVLVLLLAFALIEIWISASRLAFLRLSVADESAGPARWPGELARTHRSVWPVPYELPVTGALLQDSALDSAGGSSRHPFSAPAQDRSGGE